MNKMMEKVHEQRLKFIGTSKYEFYENLKHVPHDQAIVSNRDWAPTQKVQSSIDHYMTFYYRYL